MPSVGAFIDTQDADYTVRPRMSHDCDYARLRPSSPPDKCRHYVHVIPADRGRHAEIIWEQQSGIQCGGHVSTEGAPGTEFSDLAGS